MQSSASDEFQFGTVDLTMPEAREWYQRVVIECNLLCKCKVANEVRGKGACWMLTFVSFVVSNVIKTRLRLASLAACRRFIPRWRSMTGSWCAGWEGKV